eukprot:Protomagalhaensia_sp_Gyna_25__1726@NODE_1901_length_1431_cov_75_698276_g1563_i0_p1_GENE_NODE_1901_length_1431_cov_75_698276_g1563_i0NODE_1901_length_1431_cov_75_698276_g1563_i0_p1_ORF_typecomplete_len432_score47_83GST_N/PF02798_20/1_2e08GST_N/PF02798_20/1_9e02GST_C_3/PF14497_6/1_3e07GST_C_3/PF14497_6/4_9e03GST_N_3/PF13417_6/0_00034GST_C/PF00043_25/0_21GST_C_2/PF13410_6/0_3_NODE_1901_length_1431_cov_75_698276_g1563_i01361329
MSRLPKLYYFDLPGRAEPARLALHIGNVPFEDVRFSFEEWPLFKPLSPSGKAPMLDLNGTFYVESLPISLWAAAESKLLPPNPRDLVAAKTLVDITDPAWRPLAFYYAQITQTPAEFFDTVIPVLNQLETYVAHTQNRDGYAVASGLSIADLWITPIVYQIVNSPVISKHFDSRTYPRISRIFSLVAAHPAVQKYYTNTKHPLPLPLTPVTLRHYVVADDVPPVAVPEVIPDQSVLYKAPGVNGASAVALLLKEGRVAFREAPSEQTKFQISGLSYDSLYAIIMYAVHEGGLSQSLSPEDGLLANGVATICCEIFKAYEEKDKDNSQRINELMITLNRILKDSAMAPNWSDICVTVVSLLADPKQLREGHPYVYLKRIQTPSFHPSIATELSALGAH